MDPGRLTAEFAGAGGRTAGRCLEGMAGCLAEPRNEWKAQISARERTGRVRKRRWRVGGVSWRRKVGRVSRRRKVGRVSRSSGGNRKRSKAGRVKRKSRTKRVRRRRRAGRVG